MRAGVSWTRTRAAARSRSRAARSMPVPCFYRLLPSLRDFAVSACEVVAQLGTASQSGQTVAMAILDLEASLLLVRSLLGLEAMFHVSCFETHLT